MAASLSLHINTKRKAQMILLLARDLIIQKLL